MSRDLPQFPNLEHFRKQAKVLLRQMRQLHPETKLSEAQHALARKYGFPSWAKLKARIESLPQPGATGLAGTGQFARYTEKARMAIFAARSWALKRESPSIEAEHLLLGVIDADRTLIDALFGDRDGLDTEFALRRKINRTVTPGESVPIHRPLSEACKTILQRAAEEADHAGSPQISTGHFLLGFLAEEGPRMIAQFFEERGVALAEARRRIGEHLRPH